MMFLLTFALTLPTGFFVWATYTAAHGAYHRDMFAHDLLLAHFYWAMMVFNFRNMMRWRRS